MGQAVGSGTVVPPRVPRGCVPAAWKGQAGAPQVPRPEQRGSCPWDTKASPKRTEDPRNLHGESFGAAGASPAPPQCHAPRGVPPPRGNGVRPAGSPAPPGLSAPRG